MLKNPITKKAGEKAGEVAQGVGPEFKPQYGKKKNPKELKSTKNEKGDPK
jgi:hypothetical protein